MKWLSVIVASSLVLGAAGCSAEALDGAQASSEAQELRQGSDAEVLNALKQASQGLIYVSEADYPLYTWSSAQPVPGAIGAAVVKAAVRDLPQQLEGIDYASFAMSRKRTVADFFTYLEGDPEDPSIDPEELAEEAKWKNLRNVIDRELRDARVYRFHRRTTREDPGFIVYVITGRLPSGRIGGLLTFSVET